MPETERLPPPKMPETERLPPPKMPETERLPPPKMPETEHLPPPKMPETEHLPAPHPYTDYSTTTPYTTTPSPPPLEGTGGGVCSNFFSRLMDLSQSTAFALAGLANLEERLGYAWHDSWADAAICELEEIMLQGVDYAPAVLVSRWRDRSPRWDFSRPSDVSRRMTASENEAALRELEEQDREWREERQVSQEYAETQLGDAGQLWAAALGQLSMQMTKPNFDTWLKHTAGLSWTEQAFVVGCPNAFVAEMIEQRLYTMLAQTLEILLEREVEIRFAVESTWTPHSETD